jgi:hypothetical protein
MGEGLYRSRDGCTVYAEPYDHLDPEDVGLWHDACDELIDTIRSCLSDAWWPVGRVWRRRGERVIARNGVHEVWLVEDSYARVHVTFGLRDDLGGTEALARHTLDDRSEAFFDRLQVFYDLRVRTSAWTSASRLGRQVAA